MIIYSVTVSISAEISQDWQDWMLQTHIPEVIATGCFLGYIFHQQIEPAPEIGFVTYQTRYECASLEKLKTYQQTFAPALQEAHALRYAGKFKAFRNIFQLINA